MLLGKYVSLVSAIKSTPRHGAALKTTFRRVFISQKCCYSTKVQLPSSVAQQFGTKTAVIDRNGQYSYQKLSQLAVVLADQLKATGPTLQGERVAYITPNDTSYVVSKWTTWLTGGTCVPLCKTHPAAEIDYVLEDSKPKIVISTPEYSEMIDDIAKKHGIKHFQLDDSFCNQSTDGVEVLDSHTHAEDGALIIYTSGTTGRPKGVLWSHDNLWEQVKMMVNVWQWQSDDTILHVLPLHHVHGVVNALMCPLYVGGTVIMEDKFDPEKTWDHLLGGAIGVPKTSVFMAVPTIYVKLLQYYEKNLKKRADEVKEKCGDIRLMVSGSASLPEPIFKRWKDVTSHELLERYGMTEIGMALTNPYNGPRLPGVVGKPFPGTEVKIITEDTPQKSIVQATSEIITEEPSLKEQQGELLVRGNIFKEYWEKPSATRESLTKDGWFRTGDTAAYIDGAFKIVGRSSVDIIKSGGYKISALDIERHLLGHEKIAEVAVLGVPDETWGQTIAALVVLKDKKDHVGLEELKLWCGERMPQYHIPRKLKTVTEIPKNAMGKVNKKQLLALFADC